uniref:WD40 repeat n=1 Tax=Candidatus Kentrum sp. UNK TaxID=2126344 RepID=A0A451AHR7_9GAMM|nr:MAG: WD40 repeat [Candidatus Kentron sp. UNK]VFK71584.1 MAG: WD40 repeat [Candidatus Kentron sp. UNK]
MTDLSPSPPQLVIDTKGHQALIRNVLFTPDGKELLSISDDKTIRIWDVETGALVRTLRGQMGEGPEGKLHAGALAPTDGKGRRWLAVGGYPSRWGIRLMDLNASPDAPLRLLKGHDNVIHSLAFSPDGKRLLSGSGDGTARLWDVSLAVDTGISTSPSTGILARLNASISALLNTSMQTGGAMKILRGHAAPIYAVGFSPDGERLITGSLDHTLRLWDGAGRLVKVLEGHTDKVQAAAFAPDGRYLLSGSWDKTIRLWDGRTGEFIRVLAAQDSSVSSLAISPDGKKVLTGPASPPTTANVFALPSGERLLQFDEHKNIVLATALSPDGGLAATGGGSDHEVYLWDLATGAVHHKLVGKGNHIWNVGFARDGGSLAWGNKNTRYVFFDKGPLQYRFQLRREEEVAPGDDASGDHEKYTAFSGTLAGDDGKRAVTDGSLTDNRGKRSASRDAPIASNGMDTATGGSLVEFSGKRSASANKLPGDSGKHTAIERTPNTNDGKRNGTEGGHPNDHGNAPAGGAARQGGFDLAWGGEAPSEDSYLRAIQQVGETRIRTANNQIHPTLEILRGDVVRHRITRDSTDGYHHLSLTLTPDGRAVISGGGSGCLASYDVASGEKIQDFIGHTGDVLAVAPSPDGRFLVSGSNDQTVRLWEIASGRLLLTIFPARDGEWVAWTPEGYYTASLNGDRLIGWHINQGEDRLGPVLPRRAVRR